MRFVLTLFALLTAIYVSPIFIYLGMESRIPTIIERTALYLAIVLIFYLIIRGRDAPPGGEINRIEIIVVLILTALSVWTGILFTIRSYDGLTLGVYDFTGISSLLASPFQGGSLLSSVYYASPNGSEFFLAHHFAPALILLVPFFVFAKTHLFYGIILQCIVAITLPLFYFFCRIKLNRDTSLILFFSMFFCHVYYRLAIGFHFELLVIPFFLIFFAGLLKKHQTITVIGFILTVLLREDLQLYMGLFGIYLATFQQTRRVGITVAIVSLGLFYIVTQWYIPGASGQVSPFLNYWGAGSYAELISVAAGSTARILNFFFVDRNWYDLILPFAFLPLLNVRLTIIVIIPILAIHAISTHPFFHPVQAYYVYTVLPFLIYGLIERVGWLKRESNPYHRLRQSLGQVIAPVVLAASCYSAASKKEMPHLVLPDPNASNDVRALVRRVEPGRNVHTHSFLASQIPLSNRVFGLMHMQKQIEYVILEPGRTTPQAESEVDVERMRKFVSEKARFIEKSGNVSLYEVLH